MPWRMPNWKIRRRPSLRASRPPATAGCRCADAPPSRGPSSRWSGRTSGCRCPAAGRDRSPRRPWFIRKSRTLPALKPVLTVRRLYCARSPPRAVRIPGEQQRSSWAATSGSVVSERMKMSKCAPCPVASSERRISARRWKDRRGSSLRTVMARAVRVVSGPVSCMAERCGATLSSPRRVPCSSQSPRTAFHMTHDCPWGTDQETGDDHDCPRPTSRRRKMRSRSPRVRAAMVARLTPDERAPGALPAGACPASLPVSGDRRRHRWPDGAGLSSGNRGAHRPLR